MATRRTLFARALPGEIRIEETYPYLARVGGGAHVAPQATGNDNSGSGAVGRQAGQGYVEVRVPYDGQQFFGEAALGDVRRAVARRAAAQLDPPDETLEARVGHLVVQDFGRSNLAQNSDLSSWNAVDVAVPVLGQGVESLENLQQGRLEGRWRLDYRPELPWPAPIQVDVIVTDEEALYWLQNDIKTAEGKKDYKLVEQKRRELADRLGQKAEFRPGLRILFDVRLELAAPVGMADDPAPPELKLFSLEWPGMASYRRLLLCAEDQDGKMQPYPITFEPVTRRLQWGGLRFSPSTPADEKGRYVYRAPRMELQIRDAGELLDAPPLNGRIRIEIPKLLSGLKLHYFDSLGAHKQVPTREKSVLDVALALDVVGCFEQRIFSPYQYLQFPGMVLDQMKLGDIIALLESMQFDIEGKPEEIMEPSGDQAPMRRDYLVTAKRAEGPGAFWLWLRVGGLSLHTERLRESDNGDSHKTLRGSGDLTIALRGEMAGSSRLSVEILNELHERLKQRFHFERVVK